MNLKKILIVTTLLLCLLVALDLLTGIWYWNRANLAFDSQVFNNLISPLAAIIALPIYSWALYTTIRQNKIILSQNIKPHFEREIDQLIVKAKNTFIEDEIGQNHTPEELNALNFPKLFMSVFHRLTTNADYKKDLWDYQHGEKFAEIDLRDKTYAPQVFFLMQFRFPLGSLYFFHSDVKTLLMDITQSKLTEDDKDLLKRRVKKDLLEQYLAIISFMDNHDIFNPLIPVLYDMDESTKFERITSTEFRTHYDWFKAELGSTF